MPRERDAVGREVSFGKSRRSGDNSGRTIASWPDRSRSLSLRGPVVHARTAAARPFPAAAPTPSPVQTPQPAAAIVTDLEAEARRLGFSRLGVARLGKPPHHEAFEQWLARGFAGVMQPWLERHQPLRADPTSLLNGARSVVMLATDHVASGIPAVPAGRGRVARYALGDDYHDLLRERGNALAVWLETRVPDCRTRAFVDSVPFAERDFAWLAGLGWFGKNTMLIDPQAGSYFLLTTLVTDAELPETAAVVADHCGTCTACLDACPTGALPEPGVLDARRCISALTIEDHGPIDPDLRTGMADWIFGCDICQEVCPWNRRAPGSTEPTLQPRAGETTLSLAELLSLDEAAFRERFRGSPLLRAKRRGLLRSAAIALGNRPDPAARQALVAALDDEDAVIRDAAAWALDRYRDGAAPLG
jgi:epoxyqueuosine reductase